MDRFQPISSTNSSLGAHLYSNEEVYILTSFVGLYSGPYKSIPHSSGTVYLTTHRLFYVDDNKPHSCSCFLPLDLIRETQYYAGFLKSSPKVTLAFANEEDGSRNEREISRSNSARASSSKEVDWRKGAIVHDNGISDAIPSKSWICRVCAFSNSIDATIAASQDSSVKCQLCGVSSVAKDLVLEESKGTSTSAMMKQSPQKSAAPLQISSDGISCPVCTFANHPSMSRCEMCNTALGTIEPQVLTTSRDEARKSGESLPPSGAQTPVAKESEVIQHNSVRLSFRKGGDKAFYSTLKSTLKDKSWLKVASRNDNRDSRRDRFSSAHRNIDGRTASSALDGGEGQFNGMPRRVGIEGVFSAIDLHTREDFEDMRDAFRDLEALMNRAKKMVDFAETLNAKLTRQEAASKRSNGGGGALINGNDEAANIIRSSLVRLGLPTPAITADMAKDEMEYNIQLAKELAGLLYTGSSPLLGRGRVLQKPLDSTEKTQQSSLPSSEVTVKGIGRGIIPLDELWCMWNRARGVALVSPKTLLDVSQVLPTLTIPPISCKTFQSGLRVVHTIHYQTNHFSQRVQKYIATRGTTNEVGSPYQTGISTLDIANKEDCPLHLVSELLNEVEYQMGSIVRDDQGEVTWYENLIIEFDWDRWRAHKSSTMTVE